jgi:cystinosin
MAEIIDDNNNPTNHQDGDDDEDRRNEDSDGGHHGGGEGRSRGIFRRTLSLLASPLTDDTGSFKSVVAGLFSLFVVGAAIGLGLPKNQSLPSPWYRSVSAVIGWIYFVAWSVSFYPQVLSNYKRRCTIGLSPDFCVLNVIGFSCYATYNVTFFYSKTVQELYRKRHGEDAEITVQANDVAFALHALTLSLITVIQIIYYGGGIKSLKLSKPIHLVIFVILAICAVYPILIVDFATTQHKHDPTHSYNDDTIGRFNWLDYLYLLSFVKIGISLIKYIPQVILNYGRKSTVGWSIWNILLDFTGGILSILQVRNTLWTT